MMDVSFYIGISFILFIVLLGIFIYYDVWKTENKINEGNK